MPVAAADLTAPVVQRRPRLDSVDIVRGLIMVVMPLGHTRDMFSSATFAPLDLSRTTPAYVLTRFITHFCAPGFVLLGGTGACLSRKPPRDLSRFLLTRGLWLVVVEITVVKLAWSFNFN